MIQPQEPAFPFQETAFIEGGSAPPCYGLSIRDYFAAKALASLDCEVYQGRSWADDMAEMAYAISDAMIARSNKAKGGTK